LSEAKRLAKQTAERSEHTQNRISNEALPPRLTAGAFLPFICKLSKAKREFFKEPNIKDRKRGRLLGTVDGMEGWKGG